MSMARTDSKTAFLSIGSNIGDRLLYLHGALQELEHDSRILLEAVSSVYETEPIGYIEQPPFLNIAIRLSTTLAPLDLLHVCQSIENHFQRDRDIHWGPRTLDIDLLTYENVEMQTEELTLPHPRMLEREFVMIPLRELETGEVGCSQGVRPAYENWYVR